jgi:DNA helicase IV
LHRAAYLLYTHRFPLDGQGVLVIGPNRLFMGYIEQVLPSLGEAGVEMAVLADLVAGVRVTGRDVLAAARVKGDLRMVNVVRRAVRDRQRPLRRELVVGIGARRVRLSVAISAEIVAEARRRFRTHNAARRFVQAELFEALARSHPDEMPLAAIEDQLRRHPAVLEALNWMWPVLTPSELLHDLYGSKALVASAGSRLGPAERESLYRPWRQDMDAQRVVWTVDDVPVLDEARELLGPRPGRAGDDEPRTYGHLVVDEAQDLSPLQLRMVTRRSLNGSMTIVGDIAQSTGAWAHNGWDEILEHLPDRRPPRMAELTVGYRIPGPSMALAARILTEAAPGLSPPVSVRQDGDRPEFVAVPEGSDLVTTVVAVVGDEVRRGGSGNVAVICPQSCYQPVVDAFDRAAVMVGRAPRDGLDRQITVVPVNLVKGLEVDAAVVVEPSLIMAEEPQGARSLYVASTRATKRLTMVHARALPAVLVSIDSDTGSETGS